VRINLSGLDDLKLRQDLLAAAEEAWQIVDQITEEAVKKVESTFDQKR
jgi:hypothetical protein